MENTTLFENLIDIVLLGKYNDRIVSFITGAIEAAKTAVKSDIIDGAPEAYDTLKEVSEYIATHTDEYNALVALVGDKAKESDLTAAIARIATNEEALAKLNGTGEGSVAKALSDSKTYAEGKVAELANGQVATNTADINSLQTAVAELQDSAPTISLATEAQINALFDTAE